MTTDESDRLRTAVEWNAPDPGEWSLEAAHGANLPAVTVRDRMAHVFEEGTRAGLAPFGLPLSHVEMQFVNGWPYMSFFLHDVPRKAGPPPPDWVLKILTRVHPGFRRRTKVARAAIAERRAEAVADAWFAERDRWIQQLLDAQRTSSDELTDDSFATHLEQVLDLADAAARRHFELIFGCIPLGHWFVRCQTWGLPNDTVRSAVMHGTPVHEAARRRLDRVADALGDVVPGTIDEVRRAGPDAASALDDYLVHHGNWATEDSARSSVLAEHPEAILASIRSRRTEDPSSSAAGLLASLRELVPADDRAEFDRLAIDANRSYTMLDDNSGILGSWAAGLVSITLRHAASRLAEHGRLRDPDDIWALPSHDVVALLRGTSTLTPDQISEQAAAWRQLAELDPPSHLGGEPSPPPDPAVFPTPVARMVAAVGAFLDDKFNDGQQAFGVGTDPVEGRAVVVTHASDALDRLEPGDILVTIATTPAFNAALGIASGVVVSHGGPSCHTAVVARELGIPALVGCRDALERIPDGAWIRLDPVRTTVTVIADEPA